MVDRREIEKAKQFGAEVRLAFGGAESKAMRRLRCGLVCLCVRELGGLASKRALCEFWREATQNYGKHVRYHFHAAARENTRKAALERERLVFAENLQSLLNDCYGGTCDTVTGTKGFLFQNHYSSLAPFWRVKRGFYSLTVDGGRRAAEARAALDAR